MKRRAATVARIALVPVGVALGALLFASPAQASIAASGQANVQAIGVGAQPVTVDHWGVGNG